jgi:hypothetical protein
MERFESLRSYTNGAIAYHLSEVALREFFCHFRFEYGHPFEVVENAAAGIPAGPIKAIDQGEVPFFRLGI